MTEQPSYYSEPKTALYMGLSDMLQSMLDLYNYLSDRRGLSHQEESVFSVALNTKHPLSNHSITRLFRRVWAERCERCDNFPMAETIRSIDKYINN